MGSESKPLHVFFFPLMAHGHMIPLLDMARLFASRGVQSTIITTPVNKALISKSIDKARSIGLEIDVKTLPFPALEVGLPDGFENLDMVQSTELFFPFFDAAALLQGAFEELLEEARPDCLISDLFFPWSVDSAAKIGIPRIVFHGTSFFAMCAMASITMYKPYRAVSSDEEQFVLPNLPDEIMFTKTMIPVEVWEDKEKGLGKIVNDAWESEARSYGMIVNSFYELEPAYADHYKNVLKMRAWHIGPVSLCNRDFQEKAMRGKQAAIDEHECLKWLDSKKPDSVVYVCFGSSSMFPDPQLREIALGLEKSGQNFIWVIRRSSNLDKQDYLPEGFEERVKDQGLLIRGWAPQVLILDHPSVGGFVTHCGWNSTLEGISAGLPMVTWPLYAEQFFNQKLVTDVLKTGVEVGASKWSRASDSPVVEKEKVERAVRQVMEGEDAVERRNRARQLGMLAKRAVETDGSSYIDLNNLLDELKSKRA